VKHNLGILNQALDMDIKNLMGDVAFGNKQLNGKVFKFIQMKCLCHGTLLSGLIIIIDILNMKYLDMPAIGFMYIGKKNMDLKLLEQFGKNQNIQMMLFRHI
jgi:hypothetical protein